MDKWVMLGLLFLICSIVLYCFRKKAFLTRLSLQHMNKPVRFLTTVSIILFIAGVYTVLSPLLTVMMGADYWILFIIGILGCLMLLILLLLP
ncbi:hypothetical protein [Sporolactobacillus terrae]|uniref:Uncharacterized protein n=1 Tax=Sporolactobacillus terrae TaxID=269673 RepID=A0A410D7Q5_9BACL|nr:hypothetical protein [Sporolactobacillus terrae]QAA22127.1 hypothetical protein C0674_05570 [Sporolactobacillus terrae]QAA25099.1 hypothetical protein C0679_05545 [Sporolactobacillus terrae]UAK16919.1 hypothetical protein K7399_02915 [Sporolactobacillus terrae]BBN98427.1 hypothetical protein St703_11320 [Sporolactobacillus terrae]